MTPKYKSFLDIFDREGRTPEAALSALGKVYKDSTWGNPKRQKKIDEILSNKESQLYLRKIDPKKRIIKKSKNFGKNRNFESSEKENRKKNTSKRSDKNKGGRPTGYTPQADEVAREILALGGHDMDVQAALGISQPTYYRWKIDHPTFHAAVLAGKDFHAVEQVESALIKRAKGFNVKYKEMEYDEDGRLIEVKEKVKVFAPDTAAAKAVLYNRAPERWKDKQGDKSHGDTGVPEALKELAEGLPD